MRTINLNSKAAYLSKSKASQRRFKYDDLNLDKIYIMHSSHSWWFNLNNIYKLNNLQHDTAYYFYLHFCVGVFFV